VGRTWNGCYRPHRIAEQTPSAGHWYWLVEALVHRFAGSPVRRFTGSPWLTGSPFHRFALADRFEQSYIANDKLLGCLESNLELKGNTSSSSSTMSSTIKGHLFPMPKRIQSLEDKSKFHFRCNRRKLRNLLDLTGFTRCRSSRRTVPQSIDYQILDYLPSHNLSQTTAT